MGGASEWLRVLELSAFWGIGVFLWQAIGARKSFAGWRDFVPVILASLLFGMFVVFGWRVLHGGIVFILAGVIAGLFLLAMLLGMAERRAGARAALAAEGNAQGIVQSEALANLVAAQKLSRTGSFGWSVGTGEITWSDKFRIFEYRLDKADDGARYGRNASGGSSPG